MNDNIICSTCGTAYPAGSSPDTCITCLDERQWVPQEGQLWTKPGELHRKHSIKLNRLQNNLYELEINPMFAIGQRALLVLSEQGNILWDCIPMLDEMTIEFIKAKGGLKAIAFSHPHFYSNMNDWAQVFECPAYIHEKDEQHIIVKGKRVNLWTGNEMQLWDGMRSLILGDILKAAAYCMCLFFQKKEAYSAAIHYFFLPAKSTFLLCTVRQTGFHYHCRK